MSADARRLPVAYGGEVVVLGGAGALCTTMLRLCGLPLTAPASASPSAPAPQGCRRGCCPSATAQPVPPHHSIAATAPRSARVAGAAVASCLLLGALRLPASAASTRRRRRLARWVPSLGRVERNSVSCVGRAARRGLDGVPTDDWDVVVVGAGLGGLACAAALGKAGRRVLVVEAHTACGGCAHSFTRRAPGGGEYLFDSGPSIITEMGRLNPLQQALQYVGAENDVEWIYYDGWGMLTPEGPWKFKLGPDNFRDEVLPLYDVPAAELDAVVEASKPLARTGHLIPGVVLRDDDWQLLPLLLKFPGGVLPALRDAPTLNEPFSVVLDQLEAEGRLRKGSWLRKWMDALAFSLSGLDSSGTTAAAMAFTVDEMHKEGSRGLAYPKGGIGSVVDAFEQAVERNGGMVCTGVRVEQLLLEDGLDGARRRATGVICAGGKVLRAKEAVVCNSSVWDTAGLLPQPEADVAGSDLALERLREDWLETPMTRSYLHLHLGLDATGLDLSRLLPHYTAMVSWDDVTAEQNMVAISNPALLDPSLCPEGKLVLHLYCAGNEPFDIWEAAAAEGGRAAVDALKASRAERLWSALEEIIPDARKRTEVAMVGSPLTHRRFLRRRAGTYGPVPIWGRFGAGQVPFRTARDAVFGRSDADGIEGLLLCGDSTFPGIGVPAVVISGFSAAHTNLSVWEHIDLLSSAGY